MVLMQIMYTEEPEEDYLDAAFISVLQINSEETEGIVFLIRQRE